MQKGLIKLLNKRGMYTVEGAFTIVIFTILIMSLLSFMTVIGTEAEIQNAINQTAMQLSQYSYAVGDKIDIENNETSLLKGIIQDVKREAVGFATGSVLCKLLKKDRVDEKALRLVEGGYNGLNFSASNVLGDGKTITVIVVYKINVNTFGLFEKQLNICQKAQTAAWLPYYSSELAAENAENGGSASVWNETNFVRGKYFVASEKEKVPKNSVKSGQGIDLYDSKTGKATEIFSINVFCPSYSDNSGDTKNPSDYFPKEENLKKILHSYLGKYKRDVNKVGRTITMDSGAEEKFSLKEGEIILVLPNEVNGLKNFESVFKEFEAYAKSKENVRLKIVYREDAL